nr:putative endosialidase [uncultured Mediterranean phage uvMED]
MADTFTNDLRLRLQESGANSGQWGSLLNDTITNIASAFSLGSEAIPNASTHTITLADDSSSQDEARSLFLKCTGGGQACTVTLAPNTVSKVWIISNETSYTLTFSQGSGANVAVSAGAVKVIVTDGAGSGAAVVDALSGLDASLSGLTVDTTTLVVDATNNRVGIGTSSPDSVLEANITTSGSGANNNTAGSSIGIGSSGTTQPILGMRWTGASHVGISGSAFSTQIVNDTVNSNAFEMYTTGASPLVFGTGAAERMRITSSGNVIKKVPDTSTNGGIAVNNGTYDAIALGTGGYSVNGGAATDGGIRAYNNLLFGTGSTSTERLRINANGDVGIGVSNPSDYYAKDLVVTGPAEGGITIASTGNHTNYLLFADSTSGVARYAGMVGYAHDTDTMSFRTNSVQRMAIDANGKVGIGTNNPNNTLSILGSVNQLDIETTTTGVTVESIDRSDVSAQSDLSFYARNGEHKFFGAAYSERMRIDASGNLILKKNLVLESTSEGIDFSGVGASAQTLDDYEEGTWTMGLGTTSSGFSASITNNIGTYTKVGNTVNVRIYTGAVNVTGAGSGTALITGLPFTVSNSGNANSNYSAASFAHTTLFSTTYEGYGAIGQNYVVVVQVGTISTATFATGNGKYMMFTLTYKTDA